MSLSSIAFQNLNHGQHTPGVDPRLQVNAGSQVFYISTAFKTVMVTAAIFLSLGSTLLLGPIAGIVVALSSAVGLLLMFSSCCEPSHSQHGAHIPWHHRLFQFPLGDFGGGGHHVHVGGGHMGGHGGGPTGGHHVHVGGGHMGGLFGGGHGGGFFGPGHGGGFFGPGHGGGFFGGGGSSAGHHIHVGGGH